ncbi:MAG: GntR family transcriptional regulator [Firmicutes bacterium]|nr:GntR family transcriptional regulator [Bacillota bacterium]
MEISKVSAVPIYQQLEDYIRDHIESGQLKPGDRLPSETELSKRYRISRMTVRKALERLEFSGYLERYPGKGTFVAAPKIPQKVSMLHGFHNKMAALGLTVTSTVLDVKATEAGLIVERRLGLQTGEKVYQVARLRSVEGLPVAIQIAHIPVRLCPDLTNHDLSGSLTALMAEKYGLRIRRFAAEMEPTVATADEARLFRVSLGVPLLKVMSVAFAERDLPVRYSIGWYRGDRLRFIVEDYDIVADISPPLIGSRSG